MILRSSQQNPRPPSQKLQIIHDQPGAHPRRNNTDMPQPTNRHPKSHITELRPLTNAPLQQGDRLRPGHELAVQNQILHPVIEPHQPAVLPVPTEDEVAPREVRRSPDDRSVDRVAQQDGTDRAADSAFYHVGPRREVDYRRLARGSEAAGLAVSGGGVARGNGKLDGSCVVGFAVAFGAVVFDVAEDGPVVAVGYCWAYAVVVDYFVPVRGGGGSLGCCGGCEEGEEGEEG